MPTIEDFEVIEYFELIEDFEIIHKTYFSEPFWNKVVNKS